MICSHKDTNVYLIRKTNVSNSFNQFKKHCQEKRSDLLLLGFLQKFRTPKILLDLSNQVSINIETSVIFYLIERSILKTI